MLASTELSAASLRRPTTQDSAANETDQATQHDQRYVEPQWAFAPASERKSGKPSQRPTATVGIFNDFSSDGAEQQRS